MKDLIQKLRPVLLSLLGMGVGYFSLCFSTALLYTLWFMDPNHFYSPRFVAFAAVFGFVLTTLCSYLVTLIARRAPVINAFVFSLMLTLVYTLPALLVGTNESLLVLVLNVAIALSGAMIGGWFRYWQLHRVGVDISQPLAES
ncbi:MAG: hypothetical protein AAFY72_06500 [Cyanobacteria bacterium J06649_4]